MAGMPSTVREDCFRWPLIREETIEKVAGLLRSGAIHHNAEVSDGFEADLRRYFQVPYALLVCNGTAAALSAYYALGLGRGDEIVAPSFTHWASVLPATLLGCQVAFADTEPNSLCISLEAAESAITPATRAIVVSHMYGNPADVPGFRALCDRRGLFLIEDISHAPGATVQGSPVGSQADVAFFSMQATKTICGGEGGAVLVRDLNHYARAVELGHPKRISRLPPAWQRYNRVGIGYKLTLSPVLAIIAWESFQQLDVINSIRADMLQELISLIGAVDGLSFSEVHPGATRVYWEYEMFLRGTSQCPAKIAEALRGRGFIADVPRFEFLPDLPHFSATRREAGGFPNAMTVCRQALVLRPFSKRNSSVVAEYAQAFREVLNDARLQK